MRQNMQQPYFGRYREIVLAVALFLVLDSSVLALNFYISFQIDQSTVAINLAGRQRMLSQSMSKDLLMAVEDRRQSRAIEPILDTLTNTVRLFETTLAGFHDGGIVTGGDDRAVHLAAITDDEGRTILLQTRKLWLPFRDLLHALRDNDAGDADLQAAATYARMHNLQLLALMNQLTTHLEYLANDRADMLRRVQAIGMLLALINFVFILFKFLRRLNDNDRRIEQTQTAMAVTNRELLAARNAADAANAAKSLFLATMSHEIRTPMNGVLGLLELLQLNEPDAGRRALLDTAQTSAFSLLRILDDILDLSKVEAGRLSLESVPLNPAALVRSVIDTMMPNAAKKNLHLYCRIDPRLPPVLHGDPVRLRQILFNLISNGIKFTATTPERQGKVHVHAELVQQDGSDSGKGDYTHLRLGVIDNGIGIDAAVVRQLFQPFTQADNSTARRYSGTGLGLAICHRLTTLMGGRIEVHSTPGIGSEFHVYLTLRGGKETNSHRTSAHRLLSTTQPAGTQPATVPAAAPLAANIRTPTGESPPTDQQNQYIAKAERAGRLILVAEDNLVNQLVIRQQIAALGHVCLMAANGREALVLWQNHRIGLLLTDCHMPEMDGYVLASQLREEEARDKRSRTPVIAITASALPNEAERCRDAGMDACLVKPVDLATLQHTLAQWLPPIRARSAVNGAEAIATAVSARYPAPAQARG